MAEALFSIPHADALAVRRADLRRLVSLGDGNAALLYLYLLERGGVPRATAAAELKMSAESLDAAAALLEKSGLFGAAAVVERGDTPPEYSVEDVERAVRAGAFGVLVPEVQRLLGSTLSGGDLTVLFGLYDWLGLPPEVILLLVGYCIETTRRNYGEGRKPTMKFIEREACAWARSDVVTLERAEEYIRQENTRREAREEVKRRLQISGRQLVKSEIDFVDSWLDMGFKPEALSAAYDRTVLSTGQLTWRYMDSILKSWHSRGLHTPAEIEARDPFNRGRSSAKGAKVASATVAPDDAERMERFTSLMDGRSERR